MKSVITPKVDIVLSNGMFLRRGVKVEVEIPDNDFNFISPYVEEHFQKQINIIDKPKRAKKSIEKSDELD